MLTAVPHYEQYACDTEGRGPAVWSSRPHRDLERLAVKIGIPYLNSFKELRPYIEGTPQHRYYYRGNMHFNPRGYRLWADVQLQFLLDPANGLLPESFIGR
jgi:hypothetical protein